MFILNSDSPEEKPLCYDFVEQRWYRTERTSFDRLMTKGSDSCEFAQMSRTDAIWFLEMHHAFNGQGDDEKVEKLLSEWAVKKEAYRSEFDANGWPAKYVETTFYLNGKQYSITPDSIGLEQGSAWDEGFMEFLQSEIGDDLKKIGATEIRHMGFLD